MPKGSDFLHVNVDRLPVYKNKLFKKPQSLIISCADGEDDS
jgi:hypothetical protein